MKKLILLICIMITSFTYSQTETERIIDKYSDKISQSFEEGLQKVAPVAEQGFEVAVRLQIAKGTVYMLGAIMLLTLILMTFFYKPLVKYIHEVSGGSIYGFVVVSFIPLGILLYNGITRLIAPEWFAIKEIIEMF